MPSPRAVAGVTQALIPFARLQPREVLLITPLTSFVQQGQEPQAGALPGLVPALAPGLLTPSIPTRGGAGSARGWELPLPAASRARMSQPVPVCGLRAHPKYDQSSCRGPGHPRGARQVPLSTARHCPGRSAARRGGRRQTPSLCCTGGFGPGRVLATAPGQEALNVAQEGQRCSPDQRLPCSDPPAHSAGGNRVTVRPTAALQPQESSQPIHPPLHASPCLTQIPCSLGTDQAEPHQCITTLPWKNFIK